MSYSANTEFDVIFAGGGTAACVIAGRLAIADPSLKILILEGGLHTHNQDSHIQPARYISHLAPTSTTVTFNIANPSEDVGGRAMAFPSGRCLGGGSSVNFAAYTRAAASDYDDWETVHGNIGWGSKDLIPLLCKTETYQVKEGRPTHGYSGPLKVSYGGIQSNVAKQYLEVASQYDKEREMAEDSNDLSTINVYSPWAKWISDDTGTRQDVPHHFIYNQENKNLQILVGKRVKRVMIENNRATGVEYSTDLVSCPEGDQTPCFAKASRLVVVSAGAFGSPMILERSGIGGKDILERNDIQQIVDLPGVGENYQDHPVIFAPYFASDEAETLDAFFRGEPDVVEKCTAQWKSNGKGAIAQNGVDAAMKLRPNSSELKELGPEFEDRWTGYFENSPDKAVMIIAPVSAFVGDFTQAPPRNYFSACYFLLYAISTGRIHIKSSDDSHVAPDFTSGFFSHPADLAALRLGYKKTRELFRRMPVYRGEYPPTHPVFPKGSSATAGEASGPIDITAPDIEYTPEDNAAIDDYHRNFVQTAWHSLGTCAMKPREKGGVVDERLNVYGVCGLKVADMSIAPSNVGANTYSTALMIGEKAAEIIAKELGIRGM